MANTHDFIAWLEAVERFAVRVDDAPLALCALSAKHNRGVLGHLAALLRELSRFAGERAGDVIEIGTPLARCQYERAIECSKLTAQGWDFIALEAERRR